MEKAEAQADLHVSHPGFSPGGIVAAASPKGLMSSRETQ
jgi:hypothetical protein